MTGDSECYERKSDNMSRALHKVREQPCEARGVFQPKAIAKCTGQKGRKALGPHQAEPGRLAGGKRAG